MQIASLDARGWSAIRKLARNVSAVSDAPPQRTSTVFGREMGRIRYSTNYKSQLRNFSSVQGLAE